MLAGKKINTQLAFVYNPNGNKMDQMVRNDIVCDSICNGELLFCTHTLNFNIFFDDFKCIFTQICCLSRLLSPVYI